MVGGPVADRSGFRAATNDEERPTVGQMVSPGGCLSNWLTDSLANLARRRARRGDAPPPFPPALLAYTPPPHLSCFTALSLRVSRYEQTEKGERRFGGGEGEGDLTPGKLRRIPRLSSKDN